MEKISDVLFLPTYQPTTYVRFLSHPGQPTYLPTYPKSDVINGRSQKVPKVSTSKQTNKQILWQTQFKTFDEDVKIRNEWLCRISELKKKILLSFINWYLYKIHLGHFE